MPEMLSPADQRKLVESDPNNIAQIPNPTIAVQRFAVAIDPMLIGKIESPAEEIQLLAIESAAEAFKLIKHPAMAARELNILLYHKPVII